MTVGAQEYQIRFAVVAPITIYVMYCQRHLASKSIMLVPTAHGTLFAILFYEIAANMVGDCFVRF